MKTTTILALLLSLSVAVFAQKKDDKKKGLPLDSLRTIPIEVNEGSWIHLDVSPDGKTIVFELLGDIYTLPMAGGRASRLTKDIAFDSQPRFSPDGKEIVFISDASGGENVYVMTLADTTKRQLTEGNNNVFQSPEWTPDGQYIVVSKGAILRGVPKLQLLHKDGGSGMELIKEPEQFKTVEAAFGPDGRYIWFSHRNRNWQYNAVFPQYQLAVYDRETGKYETKTSRYGSAFRPTLSPDGKYLVYGSRHDAETGLVIRALATGDEKWLAYPIQRDDQESIATRDVLPGMSFTPDSQFLVLSYGGKIMKLPIAGGDAVEIPFTVKEDLEVGPSVHFNYKISDDPTFIVKQIRNPVLSPNGKKLAFSALDRLYVMDYPNGTPARVSNLDMTEAHPAWSPDGNSLAFVTWSNAAGGHIYKTTFGKKTTPPVKLTQEPAVYRDIAWSATGRIVSYKAPMQAMVDSYGPTDALGVSQDLVWIPESGGKTTVIATAKSRNVPHFTVDKDRIFLYDDEKGLVSIRWDGTDEKAYLKVTGKTIPGTKKPTEADYIKMAPKGDRAMALLDNEVFLVTVPMVGGETPSISVNDPTKASFPARRLTDLGGQFPAWTTDASAITWSIGNAFFYYDLAKGEAFADSLKLTEKAKAEEKKEEKKDEGDEKTEEKEDEKKDKPTFKPDELRVKVEVARDIPKGKVVLTGARVITMNGKEVIENGAVYIENNRIIRVGKAADINAPADAQVMDVTGKTIVPGFVDAHAHMWPEWEVHKDQAWMYTANLAYGVTTTRDPQTATTDVLTYEDMVMAGRMLGPRIYSTGPGVGYWNTNIRDLDHARQIMRRYKEYFDTKTIKMYITGNRQQRQWVIQAARENELMPTTEGALDLKLDLTQVIDGFPGHEHSFPIYPLYSDVTSLLAQLKTAYTPTLLVSYGGPWAENYYYATEKVHDDEKLSHFTPHQELDEKSRRRGGGGAGWFMDEEHVFQKHAEFVKDLYDAGGLSGIGSHGQLQGLGYHWELWSVGSGGLTPHEALRVATIQGAEDIGLKNEVGSLEAGKLADLIVLDANPLENLRNTNTIKYVMKNGRLYEGVTLSEVYPNKVERKDWPWNDFKPVGVPGVK
ncbi:MULTISPECIES: amidohydrolase family protein [unclassified Imperialibacter]|uniref:amidohydrolase family protein n=1 Tax=unclassified Imperialibacter TaxID=2629706 RepID=UPI001254F95C|nr:MULTISPECIES: amidohydrolase family protein [unclassified Imperialibacter]CAD5273585.1 Amidohydrolase [Imperialibacter sp. 75]CAD5273971.1 Amidohydrolase [Imperialibacter sp. 89]VVT22792.1 Amidohydrolase [Imperialibacter sp. EC-SDR9]